MGRPTTRTSRDSRWPVIRNAGSPGGGSGRPGPRLVKGVDSIVISKLIQGEHSGIASGRFTEEVVP